MIGIFDSGSGGLSVLAALHARAPELDVVYFGDLAHVPYGSRAQADVRLLTIAGFKILRDAGADHLVSACNTVSTAVIRPYMRGDGIIEMVGAAVSAVQKFSTPHVAVAATPATIESGMYQKEFQRANIRATMIACPNLAAAIEYEDVAATRTAVDAAVAAMHAAGADVLLLACTHYARVPEMFACSTIDPADAVAQQIIASWGSVGNGTKKFIASKDSPIFATRVQKLFGPREIILK